MIVPTLTTSRLHLRPFLPQDAPHLFNMYADPDTWRFTGEAPFADVAEAKGFITNYDQYKRYGTGRLTLLHKCNGAFIGWCGLRTHEEDGFVELGFRITREHRRQGYATEASLACLQDGFSRLALPQIVARTLPGNTSSISVLEKCGFTFDGIMQSDNWPALRYSLWQHEWRQQTGTKSVHNTYL